MLVETGLTDDHVADQTEKTQVTYSDEVLDHEEMY